MESKYLESRPIMPRQLTYVLSAVFAATVVFMAFSSVFLDVSMPVWAIPAVAVVFALIIAGCFILRFTVGITDDSVDVVYAFRKLRIPLDEIIDRRTGEILHIKSYDKWNLKGVKYITYSAIGDDEGIALKLTGKRVLVLSSRDPEAMAALIPHEE